MCCFLLLQAIFEQQPNHSCSREHWTADELDGVSECDFLQMRMADKCVVFFLLRLNLYYNQIAVVPESIEQLTNLRR